MFKNAVCGKPVGPSEDSRSLGGFWAPLGAVSADAPASDVLEFRDYVLTLLEEGSSHVASHASVYDKQHPIPVQKTSHSGSMFISWRR